MPGRACQPKTQHVVVSQQMAFHGGLWNNVAVAARRFCGQWIRIYNGKGSHGVQSLWPHEARNVHRSRIVSGFAEGVRRSVGARIHTECDWVISVTRKLALGPKQAWLKRIYARLLR